MSWTARGQLDDGRRYVVTWPGGLPAELRPLVESAVDEGAAVLGTPTGPTLLPPAPAEDDGGAWLLSLLCERTTVERVTGRPPTWPLPPGAVG